MRAIFLKHYMRLLLALFSAGGFLSNAFALDINLDFNDQIFYEYEYLEDSTNQMSLVDVQSSNLWKKEKYNSFNKGFNESTWWLRTEINNVNDIPVDRFIEVANSMLDHLSIYIVDDQAGTMEVTQLGDSLPFVERPITHRNFIVPLQLQALQSVEVYFKLQTQSAVQLPLKLWKQDEFYSIDLRRIVVFGIYFGIMIIMALYNLFLAFVMKDRTYIYYFGFVTSMLLLVVAINGFGFQYLWPNSMNWNDVAVLFFAACSSLFSLGFVWNLLPVSKNSLWAQGFSFLIVIAGCMMITPFVFPYASQVKIAVLFALIAMAYAFSFGIYRWNQGNVIGKYYTMAWCMMFAGGIAFLLSKMNILPQNSLTEYAINIGSAFEVLLLSFALAERINVEKKLRYIAQKLLVDNEVKLRETQNSALEMERRNNQMLEQNVAERTKELQALNDALKELSETDKLTNLKNRAFLDAELENEVSHCFSWKKPLSVLLMDIDHFKNFNDEYGHLLGDECIKEVALKLQRCVNKQSDCIARFGGEEFCAVLPDTDEQGAMAVAERIRESVENLVLEFEGKEIKVTMSVGVVSKVPEASETPADFLKKADEALYSSKAAGRNKVTRWEA